MSASPSIVINNATSVAAGGVLTNTQKVNEPDDELVRTICEGNCILFLGAGINAKSPDYVSENLKYRNNPPAGQELASAIAAACSYPIDEELTLQRVSLYCKDQRLGRRKLENTVVRSLTLDSGGNLFKPSAILQMMARLPFRIIITTNYDDLYLEALKEAGKTPTVAFYDQTLQTKGGALDFKHEDLTVASPLVYKMHGDIHKPASMILTEDDYVDFIYKMGRGGDEHPIGESLQKALKDWNILYIGYSLRDFNLRVLLKALKRSSPATMPEGVALDYKQDKVIEISFRSEGNPKIDFIIADFWDYVPALYRACMKGDFRP